MAASTDPNLMLSIASAEDSGDKTRALALWQRYVTLYSSDPTGYIQAGKMLLDLKLFAEADTLFEQGLRLCKSRFDIANHYAWSAFSRSDWSEAMTRWSSLAIEFPMHWAGPEGVARALVKLGRFSEADDKINELLPLFPSEPQVLITHAKIASARQDWRHALDRWNVAARFTELDPTSSEDKAIALWHVQLETAQLGTRASKPEANPVSLVAIEQVKDQYSCNLVRKFESVGENCEFGLLQRRYEAEPLGLLRWTYIKPTTLVTLLEQSFLGLGEEKNLTLTRSPWNEYFIEDKKFGVIFHTWSHIRVDNETEFLKKQSARLRWLRDKLLEDIRDGEKIFVYKVHHGISQLEIDLMLKGFSNLGKATLLIVRISDDHNPPGSAQLISPNLIFGYLSRLNPIGDSTVWDIPSNEWLRICEISLLLLKRDR